jgi:60 kDa SS-A/Ro ribonucleoprotein
MGRYANLARQPVPQSEPLDSRQVKNNAGGHVYALDDWKRLERFLILGSDQNTYYQKARDLTKENAACVERCWKANPEQTAAVIASVSKEGRAPKNDPAIFALALGASNALPAVRAAALGAVPAVCRTSTHLFMFVDCCRALGRGWGRAMKRAVAAWYESRTPENLAYQVVKYRQRESYTHKRLIESSHARALGSPERASVYRWARGKQDWDLDQIEACPIIIRQHIGAMAATDAATVAKYATALPWEALPTEFVRSPEVTRALLPSMGLGALVRQLGIMTASGVIAPLSAESRLVADRLSDVAEIKKSRLHPFNLLLALATYNQGHGHMGKQSWVPVPVVSDALEAAFYSAFKAIEPSGARTLIGLDVSGSMSSPLMGSPLSVCEGAAAMAMATMRSEKNWHVMAFDQGFRDLRLSASMSLAEVTKKTRDINGGGTDCALPMIWAMNNKVDVDTFLVMTDNETWAGHVHPMQALKLYRQTRGIAAKLCVAGMTSTGFSIADPADGGCLDVIGFDSAAPAVIADFSRPN